MVRGLIRIGLHQTVFTFGFEKGTTPNGVFGTKIMEFHDMLKPQNSKVQEMEASAWLPVSQCALHLDGRRDKVRQAVSWAKAADGYYAWTKGNLCPGRNADLHY
jgi:LPS sulfotransferase NodH